MTKHQSRSIDNVQALGMWGAACQARLNERWGRTYSHLVGEMTVPAGLSQIRRARMAYSAASRGPDAEMAASSLRWRKKATRAGTAARHCRIELKKQVFPRLCSPTQPCMVASRFQSLVKSSTFHSDPCSSLNLALGLQKHGQQQEQHTVPHSAGQCLFASLVQD